MHVSNEREKTKGHDNAGHTIISEGTTGHGIKIRKKTKLQHNYSNRMGIIYSHTSTPNG